MNVLVTGASSGVGRALCELLVRGGDRVWGIARRGGELASLAASLGGGFSWSVADVTATGALVAVAADMARAGFAADVVIVNAGIYVRDRAAAAATAGEGGSEATQASTLATNYTGALAAVEAFASGFAARGGGTFVAVSSVFAVRPDPLAVGYAASKAALTMAFRALALRHHADGIRFRVVLLGPVAATASGRRLGGLLVPDAAQAAAGIVATVHRAGTVHWHPRLVGLAFRATAWLPDRAFDALIAPLRRR